MATSVRAPRIVLVSNRVIDPALAAQAGGVAVALADVMQHSRGLWVGWSGEIGEDDQQSQSDGLVTLNLSAGDHRDYYLGYANSVLWPTFHNRLDLALFEAGYFAAYVRVNERFAAAVQRMLGPDDVVWVHDYHFLLLGRALRALGVTNRIGFFLHIPFPPTQAFLAIPEHAQVAEALAAYDLVGVQTVADVGRMINTLENAVAARVLSDGRLRVGGRELTLASFPIGIDPGFAEEAQPSDLPPGFVHVVSADRLDYTKGLPQKFRAFGRLLARWPQYRGRTTLTQIAAPSRDSLEAYSDIRSELESLCGAVNGRFGEVDWVPINYIRRAAPRSVLFGMFRKSRVGLITPLCDGMNLVAKEYVAAQDAADPGALVLSRFAGAAEQMPEAMIVNPYDVEGIAEAVRTALEMPLDERRARHASLRRTVEEQDVTAWAASFLDALNDARGGRRAAPDDLDTLEDEDVPLPELPPRRKSAS